MLPSGIEPGWNHSPGKSRERALNADLAVKEQTMRQALSRAAVSVWATSVLMNWPK